MIEVFFSLAAISILALSVFKTSRLLNEFNTLDKQTQNLQNQFKSRRLILREKLNRVMILQKQQAGEPIPTLTFQKLGKTVYILSTLDTIYSIAEDEGFGLTGTCEGNGDCALCAITIVKGNENISPMNEDEAAILKKLNKPTGCRLSCQSRVKGDMVVNFLE